MYNADHHLIFFFLQMINEGLGDIGSFRVVYHY